MSLKEEFPLRTHNIKRLLYFQELVLLSIQKIYNACRSKPKNFSGCKKGKLPGGSFAMSSKPTQQ